MEYENRRLRNLFKATAYWRARGVGVGVDDEGQSGKHHMASWRGCRSPPQHQKPESTAYEEVTIVLPT